MHFINVYLISLSRKKGIVAHGYKKYRIISKTQELQLQSEREDNCYLYSITVKKGEKLSCSTPFHDWGKSHKKFLMQITVTANKYDFTVSTLFLCLVNSQPTWLLVRL